MERKINLDILPRKIFRGRNVIDWDGSVGSILDVKYGDIDTVVKIVKYDKENRTVDIENNGNIHTMYTGHFTECKLGSLFGVYNHDFKYEIGQNIIKENMNITIIDRRYNKNTHHREYKILCNKCGFNSNETCYKNGIEIDYYMDEYNLKQNDYCPCCSSNVVQSGINDIFTTDNWMIKYFKNTNDTKKYSHYSQKKIDVKCPCCNTEKKYEISKI